MNSPRRLAGSRRNKHLPVARQTRVSDIRRDGWPMDYLPPAAHRSKPSHPARAVSIDACFGERLPERDSAKAAAARRAGDCGRYAAPMTYSQRRARYHRRNGMIVPLTRRQWRRLASKARRIGEWVA